MTPTIEISDARRSAADREWVRNVYPYYLHDLSEFDDGYYRLNERGLWEPDHLPDWLAEGPHQHALLIRADGARAGFAFVGEAPFEHMTPGLDFRLCEFFVLRSLRGGVRRVRSLPRELGGGGDAPQRAGGRFWGRVIGEYTGGDFREEPGAGGFPRQVFRTCATFDQQ